MGLPFLAYFLRISVVGMKMIEIEMFADLRNGLLVEASWLLDIGLMPDTSSASRGIGYQEVSPNATSVCRNRVVMMVNSLYVQMYPVALMM